VSLESGHKETYVFAAESALRSPGTLIRRILHDMFITRQLALTLAIRDIKAQYRQSLFGLVWMVLPPLVLTVGLTVLRANKVVNVEGPEGFNYSAYLLISTSLWSMFMASVNGPIQALALSKGVLTRVSFPRETVVVAEFIKLGINVGVQTALIMLAFLYFRIPLQPLILAAPFALLVMLLFGTMVGLFLSPFALLYKDISSAMPIIGLGWMAFTPVVVTMDDLAPGGLFKTAVQVNPVTSLLSVTRELITGLPLTHLPHFGIVTVITFIGLAISLIYFRIAMPIVIERWSS